MQFEYVLNEDDEVESVQMTVCHPRDQTLLRRLVLLLEERTEFSIALDSLYETDSIVVGYSGKLCRSCSTGICDGTSLYCSACCSCLLAD